VNRLQRTGLRWAVAMLAIVALLAGLMRDAAGAIALRNANGTQGTGVSSLTWSHTVASGSDRLLIVRIANIDSTVSVSNVTYGGAALTQLQSSTSGSGTSHVRASLWYLVAPTVGTANVVVTLSGSTRVQGYSNDLSGVSQTTPFGTPVTTTGTNNALSVTATGATGDLMMDVAAAQGGAGTATAGAGQTAITGSTGPTANDVLGMGSTKAGAASVTLTWSTTASSPWVSIGVAIKQAVGYTVSGTVFEDVNYGGGAGRTLAGSGGVGVNGATVELYNSSGVYVSSTTTAGGGAYSFASLAAGTYHVRVVNSTVPSQRSGAIGTLRGVMTFRTNASSGTPVAVTDHVGGTSPAAVDPGVGSSGATFNTSTGVFSAVLTGTAQSYSVVTVDSTNIAGVDFGFNFSTIVNTNDSGQGSLRQFITNANALGGKASLAQAGNRRSLSNTSEALPAATETSIFMIPRGVAVAGLRATVPSQLTSGVATIAVTSNLPQLTAASVSLDGSTQTANVGDTNAGLLGTGGTVGVDALTLSQVAGPEVELTFASLSSGLSIAANNVTVRGLALRSTGASALTNGAVGLTNNVTGAVIEANIIGTRATALTDPGAGQYLAIGVNSNGADSGTVRNNLITYFTTTGVQLSGTLSAAWTISGNEIRDGGLDFDNADGIALTSTTAVTISGNRITGMSTQGIVFGAGAGSGTQILNNTLTGNGVGPLTGPTSQSNVVVARSGAVGVRVEANVIHANHGAGVAINSGATGIALTRNLVYANGTIASRNGSAATGQIDIDLNSAGDDNNLGTAPFVTANDTGDADSGGNNLQNHPVLSSAVISGGTQLIVSGALNTNANGHYRIEFFGNTSPHSTGRGGAQTYLGFVNVASDGSGNASFSTTLNVTVAMGSYVTATAIKSDAAYATMSDTSEFAPNVQAGLSVQGTVFEDVNYGGGAGRTRAASGGVGLAGATVELYKASGSFVSSTTTASDGSYSFGSLLSEGYLVRVVTSSVLSSRPGSTAALLPVQTYRYESSWLTPAAVTNEVGGARPDTADSTAAAALTWTTCATEFGGSSDPCLFSGTRVVRYGADSSWTVRVATDGVACGNAIFGDPIFGTPKTCQLLDPHFHSVSSVHPTTASIVGVDFGFNFDTVVNTNDSGQGSLRQAMTNANTLGNDGNLAQSGRTAAVENLVFMLPNGSTGAGGSLSLTGGLRAGLNAFTAGIATIAPGSALPPISTSMVIDARAQPGWAGTPILELDGSGAGAGIDGFVVSASTTTSSTTLAGWVINRFTGHGVSISGGNGVKVVGNHVGTNAAGTAAAANAGSGIYASSGTHTVGGTTAADRNLLSGNAGSGVQFSGAGGSVMGNYIGVNAAGTAAVANSFGVYFDDATGGTIGGTTAGAGNLISGNINHGVFAKSGSPTTTVGNTIGLNAAGSAAIPNGTGVQFQFHSGGVVGGTTAAARNVISGNTGAGVNIVSHGGHTISGNYIGTDPAGTAAFPNGGGGLVIAGPGGNTLGGTTAGAGNVISGNTGTGVRLTSPDNSVAGNLIGLNAAGTAALANSTDGVSVGAANNTVGGTTSGARNVISGNGAAGIKVTAGSATIQGNHIGVAGDGSAAAGNAINGIHVSGTSATTTIGGSAAGAGNIIANNTGKGVVFASGTPALTISSNAIYANTSIGIDLGDNGVSVNDGAKTTGQPNQAMDSPVITAARARGNQLTVAGYVGTAAGQSLFAGSRVEVFVSDVDASGFGEGRTYLGALTADASGNFSGTVTMPYNALRAGSVLTGTATDTSNNTSEFGVNFSGLVVDWLINHNGDGVDANPGDGLCETSTPGQCTLRAAIMETNAWAGADLAVFDLPNCPGAGCIITPASALPAITGQLTLDGQTQPGWTLAPLVDLRGEGAGAGSSGLTVNAASSILRGLAIGGFLQSGIVVNANNVAIEGNYIGLQPDSATARANGAVNSATGGVYVSGGTGITIGGAAATQRNVLSGNGGAGVWLNAGTATVVGNTIGTNAAGTAALGNQRWGVHVEGGSSHRIGGPATGEGNLISGHVYYATGGVLLNAGNGHKVQGNTIGMNAARTAAIANGDGSNPWASGIDARVGNGHVIGGLNAGEGNVIAGNQGNGIRVMAQTASILGNAVYNNLWLGIDLGADGVTANNGTQSGALPNNDMDHPVITSAGYDPLTRVLTLTGYVGTGTGQALFAGARIELFASDGDATGYGEGRDFVGTLTADANGRFSGTVSVPLSVSFAVGTALTGTATDTADNTSEFGPNHVTTTMGALAPSRFNAFETSTVAGALTGVIQTRVAGVAGSIAIIAIDNSGTALQTSFDGTVTLEWMNATDNSGALDAGNCRASWAAAGSAGSAAFAAGDLGRHTTSITPATVGREWRLRISYAGPGGTVSSCSADAFAVRPDTLAITGVTDTNDTTAGTARELDNLAASGGRVHRAGRPFSLRAAARDAASAVATGYTGTPTLAVTGCVLPAGCTAGTLTVPSLVASAGLVAADTLSYSEVGAINVQLTDDSFADIDAADTPLLQRRIQSAIVGVGRFVPDRYLLAAANAPQFATQQGACAAAGQGFTFVGQNFGWATAPSFTVTAQNAAGATTALWSGALQKLTTAHVARSLAAANAQGLTPAVSWGTMTLTDAGNGVASVALSGDQFLFPRDAGAPVASFDPLITLGLAVNDVSEVAVSGNTAVAGTAALVIGTGSGIAFNQGSRFHYGRLKLQNAFGDVRRGVRANVELQKFTDRGWLRLSEDNTCITVPQPSIAFSAGTGTFATDPCTAPASAAVALRQGRGTLVLPRTAGNLQGAALVTLNIGATLEGNACTAGTPVTPVSAALPHLLGARGTGTTQDQNPAARLVWGRQHRDYMVQRELF